MIKLLDILFEDTNKILVPTKSRFPPTSKLSGKDVIGVFLK